MYPDSSIVARCAMIHDAGDHTPEVLDMWSKVKVNVILPALFQLPCGQQAIQEQCVECVCRIEIIGLYAMAFTSSIRTAAHLTAQSA